MEKIQIRFTESDYSLYHDYCAKYYQVHDTIRKQSIHAFLDLYEKGVIPVDAQDISIARGILADRCELLKQEHNSPGIDTTILLQLRTCSDILLFIDDLEKMFRLIRKQGADANYLMILAIFSTIIKENRAWNSPELVDLPAGDVEDLAIPLAGIIRARLGLEAEWHYVLRELATIAARFNQRSPELKFERDVIQVVAPVVVAQFDRDVTSREIGAVLPSYVEESELEEFESFLNQAPLESDPDREIDWDAIYAPLEVISATVAKQRERWYAGRARIPDQLAAPPNGARYPTGNQYPSYQPRGVQQDGLRTLEIAVGKDTAKMIEVESAPEAPAASPAGPAPVKHGMPAWVPIAIGGLLVIVIILATVLMSGFLNPGAGNTAMQPTVPVTPPVTTATPRPTTSPVPTAAVTTATTTLVPTQKSYSATDVGNHLVDIAFGTDNSVIRKANKSTTIISLSGSFDSQDISQLNTFIGRFDNASSTIKLGENIQRDTPADISLVFLSESSLDQINTDKVRTIAYRDSVTGTPYFVRASVARSSGTMDVTTYVNADLAKSERDRWLMRALLYNMGFYGETSKYPDSLFYAGVNNASQPSDIDWKAIQLMYGQKVTNGMTKSTVKSLVT